MDGLDPVVVTTPNREYNAKFEGLPAGQFRHRDHRFEWTRAEFEGWAGRVAADHAYAVRFLPVGPEDSRAGRADADGGVRSGMSGTLEIPELSLVVLVGATGSGKSTFARTHFLPTEIVSSDFCRGLVSDDENAQDATNDAFDLLHYIAGKRMARGRLTVVDATNVQPEARKPLVALAQQHHFLPVAIVFDLPERLCQDRNRDRPDRDFGPHVIRNQQRQLKRGLRSLKHEGFRQIHVLDSPEAVDAAAIERTPLWNNKKTEHGPFDVIGDVHGCATELEELLALLGYDVVDQGEGEFPDGGPVYAHPEGRKALFVGDLVDRGPRILDALRIARNMVAHGSALAVPGNHDMKFVRALRGRDLQITHGLDRSLAELDALPDEAKQRARDEVVRLLDRGNHREVPPGRSTRVRPRDLGRTDPRTQDSERYKSYDHGRTVSDTPWSDTPFRAGCAHRAARLPKQRRSSSTDARRCSALVRSAAKPIPETCPQTRSGFQC
jgi:predicted kinase